MQSLRLGRFERALLALVASLVILVSASMTVRFLYGLAGSAGLSPLLIGLVFSAAQYGLPTLSVRALAREDAPAGVQAWGAVAAAVSALLLVGSVTASVGWMLATDTDTASTALVESAAHGELVTSIATADADVESIRTQLDALQATAAADLAKGYRWRALQTDDEISALRTKLDATTDHRAQLGAELVELTETADLAHGAGPLWTALGDLTGSPPRSIRLGVYCLVSAVLEVVGTLALLALANPRNATTARSVTPGEVTAEPGERDSGTLTEDDSEPTPSDSERRAYSGLVYDLRTGRKRPTSNVIRSAMGCASDRVPRYRRWLVRDGWCVDMGGGRLAMPEETETPVRAVR